MFVGIYELCQLGVLAGASNGRTLLSKLMAEVSSESNRPEIVFLDFSDVDVATASFLREGIVAFCEIIRRGKSNIYPVISNANQNVIDELYVLSKNNGHVFVLCDLKNEIFPTNIQIIGDLEPKQKMTYDIVNEQGETDASALMKQYGEQEGIKHTTAWNNRLSALAKQGLILELSHGRSKKYQPLFKEKI